MIYRFVRCERKLPRHSGRVLCLFTHCYFFEISPCYRGRCIHCSRVLIRVEPRAVERVCVYIISFSRANEYDDDDDDSVDSIAATILIDRLL